MRKLLLICLMLPLLLQAKVSYKLTESKLDLFTNDHSISALSFQLNRECLVAGQAKSKIHEKLGGLELKEELQDPYYFNQIGAICFDSLGRLHIQCRLSGKAGNCGVALIAEERPDGALSLSFSLDAEKANRLRIQYHQNSDAHIFGLGEQFSHLNFQGKKVPLLAEENGIGRGDPKISGFTKLAGVAGNEFSTYCPVPFYLGNEGKGVFVRKGQPWYFDFQENDIAELYILGKACELVVWQSKDPLELISAFSQENGRFRILPEWAFGTWLGIQGGTKRVDSILNVVERHGNPVTAIWIQDWVGKRQTKYGSRLQWHWSTNEKAYPELKSMIASWRSRGIQTLGYINPFLATESAWADSLRPFLVKDATGEPIILPAGGFDALQFELNDPDCQKMLAKLIKREMIDLGFKGWMADFAEWYPEKAAFPKGDFFSRHNAYPILWQECSRMAVQSVRDSNDFVFFSRSGYRGAGKYASTYWAGDQMTSWGKNDGLPSALNAIISSGMSGIAINHSDIGGYTNVHTPLLKINRSQELMHRWMEFAAFTPIYRTHEGLSPKHNAQPWTRNGDARFFALMGKLHFSLKGYFLELNQEANENGWPMVRHLWLQYPENKEVLDIENQFMLGSELMMIPVLEPGQDSVKAYFPKGPWLHLLAQETIESKGEWRTVASPLGSPAAYVRATKRGREIRKNVPDECRVVSREPGMIR